MGKVEFWTNGAGVPGGTFVKRARQAEEWGFDGITVVDSQNLAGDCYVALAIAAHHTTTLKLGTGVTNPYTRHPAATASAIASVQVESDGRAVLGIGRGDSALAHLGMAPAPVPGFEEYLRSLHAYLAGEEVPFPAGGDVDKLRLANRPVSSRIAWLRHSSYTPVPIDVTATGPKVIRMGAVLGDRLTLAVGADPARIAWGMETAQAARREAGLAPEMPFGAYVNVVVHDDPEIARRLGEGGVSLFTRFSAMHGTAVGPTSARSKEVFEAVHDAYDMNRHSRVGSAQAAAIPQEFAEEFAILGPASYCIERLRTLIALGLDRLVIVGPSMGADRDEAAKAEQRFVDEVLPALREG